MLIIDVFRRKLGPVQKKPQRVQEIMFESSKKRNQASEIKGRKIVKGLAVSQEKLAELQGQIWRKQIQVLNLPYAEDEQPLVDVNREIFGEVFEGRFVGPNPQECHKNLNLLIDQTQWWWYSKLYM